MTAYRWINKVHFYLAKKKPPKQDSTRGPQCEGHRPIGDIVNQAVGENARSGMAFTGLGPTLCGTTS